MSQCSRRWLSALLLGVGLAVAGLAVAADQPVQAVGPDTAILQRQAAVILGPLPDAMPGADKDTPEMIVLGERLYFEPAMSVNKTQSCAECHPIRDHWAGADNQPTSTGAMKLFGSRNAPTTLNAGFQIAQFWDGRAPDLAEQAKGPILNPVEMGMPDSKVVISRLTERSDYPVLFAAAFPGQAEPVTYDNLGAAIAAFERTLITPSRFDAFMKGDASALTVRELQGLDLFLNQGCVRCHNGPLLGGMLYQRLGVVEDYPGLEDKGRFDQTKRPEDMYVFKVPMLRNITLTAPYFHNGRMATLPEAVDVMARYQLGTELSRDEIDAILRFMTTLTGEELVTAPASLGRTVAWNPPAAWQLPPKAGDPNVAYAVQQGYLLVTQTPTMLGPGAPNGMNYAGNELACTNCHQEAGTKLYGITWLGVTNRYPRFRGRSGKMDDLGDRINGCMERSLAGKPLPKDSAEMKAIQAYMGWLSENVSKDDSGLLLVQIDIPERQADLTAGEKVYQRMCQSCHGNDGQGYRAQSSGDAGVMAAPPLWGPGSFNDGAGMHRLLTATAFIQGNMPVGSAWNHPAMSVGEAYDVGAYLNSFDRPVKAGKEADYPDKAAKPVDCPYGPYADDFPQEQHQLGPYQPIQAFYAAKKK